MSFKLLSVFLSSFLAGSFFPMASEAVILTFQSQELHWAALLTIGTLGNTLGGMTCYFIGLYGGKELVIKLLSIAPEKLSSWSRKAASSEWLALFAWLPFIGELIAAALGVVSNKWKRILLYMLIGKAFRYAFVLKIGEYLFS